MRLSPLPVSDGVSISSRLFFIPVAETSMSIEMNNLFSVRDTARFETETLFFMIVWGFGSHTAQQRRQAHTKYFLCDVLIHSLCVLESVYQINRGLCGAEVMMSLVFGDFFTTGGARIAVVAGVNVSDTDFRFQIPVSS